MAKLPKLNEVFIHAGRQPINVGSAYSLRKEAGMPNKANLGPRQYGSNIGKGRMSEAMKPELEKVVQKYVDLIVRDLDSGDDPTDDITRRLHDFAHEMEGAEGEDPAELDQGGPEPGTTGGEG